MNPRLTWLMWLLGRYDREPYQPRQPKPAIAGKPRGRPRKAVQADIDEVLPVRDDEG